MRSLENCFPGSATGGEIGFGSLVGGAGVLELVSTDIGWGGRGAVTAPSTCGDFLQR